MELVSEEASASICARGTERTSKSCAVIRRQDLYSSNQSGNLTYIFVAQQTLVVMGYSFSQTGFMNIQ
jgi:hypothetical protein